ncbi:hypothetical protein EB001_18840 [bacterium]|jgi:hypothetical protein|nr:hypothetical protein [bacterium]
MIVKTLEEMEAIVSGNKGLSWDGWTVVNRYKSDKAKTSKYGVYFRGNWYISKRFEPGRDGWDIPERLVLGHAQT